MAGFLIPKSGKSEWLFSFFFFFFFSSWLIFSWVKCFHDKKIKFLCNYWYRATSHLSSFLVNDDRSVRIAAGEALAILFEFGCPKKYSSEAIQQLVEKILDQVGDLSAEAGGRGSKKKDLGSQRNFFGDLLEFLKVFCQL